MAVPEKMTKAEASSTMKKKNNSEPAKTTTEDDAVLSGLVNSDETIEEGRVASKSPH
jgi:hypothetical protein